jgi:hypothetical protein
MMLPMNSDTPFDWGDHPVPEGDDSALALGPLRLRFGQRFGEILVAYDHVGDEEEPVWSRWAPATWSGNIRLSPAFPDRLVVVKPESDLRLLPGAAARIYVRVPLRVHIEALGPVPASLLRIPTAVLSDTWWGTNEEGELGYWLDTRARRVMADEEFEEHLCICPIQLENRSEDDLQVDRIALRVAHLTVFRHGTQLWSDETRVRYLGDEGGSRLDMSGKAPTEAPTAARLTPPEHPMVRGLTARTFARIRSSIGGWL